ncbi:DUF4265 domain-containing protein [Paenibacillus arenilitoris]|uniref:DUF4265 domain-containing protein n=1 Tax=Paenibacillus arenilitoris TaxID=2772299 RepID=A0A927CJ85_9BACL|nr:DUF4265 domain-containing protein [Paenibacillus arenilitoris]MBD2867727.1 DUF4265 domain-containing protein [Paenibacillus arenilitoris]
MKDLRDYMELHLCFDNEGREVEVLDVTQLEDNVFKIEENPVFTEKVSYGDVIKVRRMNDIAFYIDTVKKSKYKRYNWLLSREVVHSLELKQLKNKIGEWKGKSEQVFGGIFIVNLPANSPIDIHAEVQRVIDAAQK